MRVIVQTAISEQKLKIQVEKLLKNKGIMSLKNTFTVINCIIAHVLQSQQEEELALGLLKVLEENEE